MIGVYDYTVLLTYLSLLSAGSGIFISLGGLGHPFYGIFCLLFCGLCDAFDGKVAATKKDRTELEKKFGIQIDSLSDIVAFGVLPACIGVAFMRRSGMMCSVSGDEWYCTAIKIAIFAVLVFYILAALIRLAYFNVSEEERQAVEGGARKYYSGLPVTSAAIVFPTVALLEYLISFDLFWLYIAAIVISAILFITPFKLKKIGLAGILLLVGIGAVEFVIILVMTIKRYI